jgi:hypothetical protein
LVIFLAVHEVTQGDVLHLEFNAALKQAAHTRGWTSRLLGAESSRFTAASVSPFSGTDRRNTLIRPFSPPFGRSRLIFPSAPPIGPSLWKKPPFLPFHPTHGILPLQETAFSSLPFLPMGPSLWKSSGSEQLLRVSSLPTSHAPLCCVGVPTSHAPSWCLCVWKTRPSQEHGVSCRVTKRV